MNRSGARTRRVLAGLAAALLAGAALTGCSVAEEAGAAALVDGERIEVDRLQALTAELAEVGGDVDPATRQQFPAGEAQRRTLEKLIASRILATAAEEEGISITSGDVDAQLAEFAEIAGGEDAVRQGLALARNVPPSYARQYVRDLLTSEQLADGLVDGSAEDPQVQQERRQALANLLIETGGEMDIEVNPRYGEWQPDSGAVRALVSGGLARDLDEVGGAEPGQQ